MCVYVWRERKRALLSSMRCRIDFLCFLPRKMTSEKISKPYFNMQVRKTSISRLIMCYSMIPLGSSLKLPHFNIRNIGKKTLSKYIKGRTDPENSSCYCEIF